MSRFGCKGLVLGLCVACIFIPSSTWSEEQICDPLEPVNRAIFWFNDKFDIYFLEPVARGYEYVMPDIVEDGVSNFFENLEYPSELLSDIVQLKFGQAAVHTGRFLVNSTVGVAGLVDVAQHIGLPDHEEDFGTALAYQGVPPGPYLVLPFLGPSTLRDAIGIGVDSAIHPFAILEYSDVKAGITDKVVWGGIALDAVQTRADMLDAVEAAKESSLDHYLFMQSAYYQYREGLVTDSKAKQDEFLGEEGDDEFDAVDSDE